MPAPTIGYGLPVSPQARKVLPLIAQLLAEGWSAAKLSEKAGIGLRTAKGYLSTIQHHIAAKATADTDAVIVEGAAVARRVQQAKLLRAERIEAEIQATLDRMDDGFLKVAFDKEAGFIEKRYDYDAQGRAKLLADLLRADAVQTDLLKELSGQALAEKALLARLKGEAIGQGFGKAMIDATAADLQGQVWDAVTLPAGEGDGPGDLASDGGPPEIEA